MNFDPQQGTSGRPVSLQDIVFGTVLAVLVGWILHWGSHVLVPMVLGLLVAYVVHGIARLMGAIPVIGPKLPSGLRTTLATALIGYGLVQLVFLFVANVSVFASRLPEFQTQLVAIAQSLGERVGLQGDISWDSLRREVFTQVNYQSMLKSGMASTASLLGWLLFILLNVAFMLLERQTFDAKLGQISSDPQRVARLRRVITDINARVGRYLAVKTMINIVLGSVSYAILLVMGVEFAPLWAIIIACLNYIPYVGSWLGVGFPSIFAVVQFGDLQTVLVLVALLSAAQFTLGNIIEPFVMGSSLNLSPYVILISLTVWTSLWGIPGAIVSVPISAVIVIILSEFPGTRALAVLLSKSGIAPH